MKKFSIILPVRNGGNYFKECVNSILSQTVTNFNLLILDNCSSDGSLEWINSVKDDRIIIYSSEVSLNIEENWGRIKNISKGEFMTMIGHDDLLSSGYLAEMEKLIEAYPDATLYQTHFDYIDEKGDFIRHCQQMVEKQETHEFIAAQMQRTIDSTGTGYMMRSKHFDELGGMPQQYPNLIFADYHLWLSLILKGYMAISSSVCFKYRLHNSISKITDGMIYQAAFTLYMNFIISLAQNYDAIKSVTDKYAKDFLMYYCESLSHRLLKTPFRKRTLTVEQYIEKCRLFANKLIPDQKFEPLKKNRINIARILDKSAFGRAVFKLYKLITQ